MTTPVVLITGALTGIGRATALAFARDRARVVVSGRSDEEGQKLTNELRKLGAVATCDTMKIFVIWWIGPSRALVVWMLLSIALEPRANLAR